MRVHALKPVGKITKALVERPPTLDGGNNDLFIEFFGVIQRRPTSDIGMWSMLQRATEGLLTTANSSEGCIGGFERKVNISKQRKYFE